MTICVGVVGSGVGTRLHIPALRHLQDVIVQPMKLPHLNSLTRWSRQELDRHLPLDLIVITTPPFTHLPYVSALTDYADLILCEKPVGIRELELRRLVGTLDPNCAIIVNYQMRFHPLISRIRARVEPQPVRIDIVYKSDAGLQDGPAWYRNSNLGGGPLMAIGAHLIDLVHFLGFRYSKLAAAYATSLGTPLTIDGVCQNGSRVTLNIDVTASNAEFTVRVVGRSSSIVVDLIGDEITDAVKSYPLRNSKTGKRTLSSSDPDGPWRRGQNLLYSSLFAAGRSGDRVKISEGTARLTDALEVHEVITAARQSIRMKGVELVVIHARCAPTE